MNKISVFLFYFFFMVLSFSSGAEEAHESFGQSVLQDLISPVTTRAWIPLVAGSGVTLLDSAFPSALDEPLQRSWSTRKPLGSTSKYGDALGQWIPNLAYAAGMAIEGWGFGDSKAKGRTELMLKASIYAGGMDLLLKEAFHERRPNGSNDFASFPSGHATEIFAFASVIGAEHEWYWGALAYSMATFVGASRINDNMHWLHDVLGGATLGMSYGLGLYYRAHPEENSKGTSTVYQILPTPDLEGAILTATYDF